MLFALTFVGTLVSILIPLFVAALWAVFALWLAMVITMDFLALKAGSDAAIALTALIGAALFASPAALVIAGYLCRPLGSEIP